MLDLDPRQLLEMAQKGESYHEELAPLLHGLDIANLNSLADFTVKYGQQKPFPFYNSPIDLNAIKCSAKDFHRKAETDFPKVISNINNLTNGSLRLRVAHQANLFPSLAVVGQVFLMDALAQRIREQYDMTSSQLFIIVDYDVAQDQRFRVAHLPNVIGEQGYTPLSSNIAHSLYQKPMWSIEKPAPETIEKWINKIRTLAIQDVKDLRKVKVYQRFPGTIEENLTTLKQIIRKAYDKADTLVEFNAFVLSQIVNYYWGMPTAFLFGSKIQSSMQNAYELLIEQWPVLLHEARESGNFFQRHGVKLKSSISRSSSEVLPLWITCSTSSVKGKCNQRLPLYITSNMPLRVYSRCPQCGEEYKFELGSWAKVNLDPIRDFGMAPRILVDNLLDTLALGISGGVGYIGQAEHMLFTNYIASRPTIGWELPPHALWRPKGFSFGTTEYRAVMNTWNTGLSDSSRQKALDALKTIYFGRASILYHLINIGDLKKPEKQDLLKKLWEDFFINQHQSVYSANIRSDISPLSVSDEVLKRLSSYAAKIEEGFV